MMEWLKKNSVSIRRATGMEEAELEGKIIVGEYADIAVDGYIKRYKEVQKRAAAK